MKIQPFRRAVTTAPPDGYIHLLAVSPISLSPLCRIPPLDLTKLNEPDHEMDTVVSEWCPNNLYTRMGEMCVRVCVCVCRS